jgi:hypothetical protein
MLRRMVAGDPICGTAWCRGLVRLCVSGFAYEGLLLKD